MKNLLQLEDIDIFDPTDVDVWDKAAIEKENKEKEIDDYIVFVITPEMQGVYSIAEVTDLSNKRPDNTLFCILDEYGDKAFNANQKKSMDAVYDLVKDNGAKCFDSLEEMAVFLNRAAIDLKAINQ